MIYQTESYIVKLGKRIAAGRGSERDIEELESFCQSFAPAYDRVLTETARLGYEPTGRFPKSTLSIRAKILRERTRLTHMQDIAGIRIVVANVFEQDAAVEKLRAIGPCEIKDRRQERRHGYSAVHMIFEVDGVPVEAQIRTVLQQQWAEVSEKLADEYPDLKYGGGPVVPRQLLEGASHLIAGIEVFERQGIVGDELQTLRQQLQELLAILGNLENEEQQE